MNITKKTMGAMTGAVLLTAVVIAPPAHATELVYYPLNPSFGGNPLNGTVLLNSALATNKHKDPDADFGLDGRAEQTPLEMFQENLERSILGSLAASATSRITDDEGNLVPGNLETQNFRINIVDMGGGILAITTTDKITGGSTTFQVSQP